MTLSKELQKQSLEAILSQLAQETRLVEQFISILEKESEQLMVFKQPEVLTQLAGQKAETASALDAAYKHRIQLAEAALPDNNEQPANLDALLLLLDPLQTGNLARQWHHYNLRLAHAKSLNENNGIMIHSYLKHNQEALETLNRAAGVQHTYNHKGQRKPVASGKPLAKG
ncbi:MAG: flagellar protein FlgN [Alcaligenaceae bacterium]|nr:flagellar protein FlgN [Alcaligenaceae bacterium]